MSVLLPAGAIVLSPEDARILYQAAGIAELRSRHRTDDRLYKILHALSIAAFTSPAVNGNESRQSAASEKTGITTVGQVARAAGVSERTVRNHIDAGILAATKPAREWVIATADAETYIAARRKN